MTYHGTLLSIPTWLPVSRLRQISLRPTSSTRSAGTLARRYHLDPRRISPGYFAMVFMPRSVAVDCSYRE